MAPGAAPCPPRTSTGWPSRPASAGWTTSTAAGARARRPTAASGCPAGCGPCPTTSSTTSWCTSSCTCSSPGTTSRFWALVARYPRAERARGFLEGVELAPRPRRRDAARRRRRRRRTPSGAASGGRRPPSGPRRRRSASAVRRSPRRGERGQLVVHRPGGPRSPAARRGRRRSAAGRGATTAGPARRCRAAGPWPPHTVGGVAQPARPQLQPDQGGEGLLGRAAGGPAPAHRLGQRRCPGSRSAAAAATTVSTQPSTSASSVSSRRSAICCSGVSSGSSSAAAEQLLDALRVARVDAALHARHGLADARARSPRGRS